VRRFGLYLLLVFLLGLFPLTVSAEEKDCIVDVAIFADTTNVKIGESVTLKAVSVKQGSSYQVNWNGARDQGTILDNAGDTYVSTAGFSSDKPGTYKVEYSILMKAGNSDKCFWGKAVETITVYEEKKTVVGADIKKLTITPAVKSDGSTIYSALGTTYVLWSDGTSEPYGTVYFFFQENEYSKNIDVVFNIDGQIYKYAVTVIRTEPIN